MENWLLDPAIPWPGIYDLLEREEEPFGNSQDFLARVLRGVGSIIPFDVGCGILEFTGSYKASYGLPQRTVDDYNSYYRHRMDFMLPSMMEAFVDGSDESLLPVIWRQHGGTEFVSDFCRPIGLGQTIAFFLPGRVRSITLHRKGVTRPFTDGDKRTLRVLNFLIEKRLALYERAEKAEGSLATAAPSLGGIRSRFPALSRREAEVASLTAQGMTAQAIAASSSLSRRTIETQLQSAYFKLGVRDKKGLIARLSAREGPTWIGEVLFPASAASP